MKRTASALVEYPGSGDEEKADEGTNVQLSKKRYVVGEYIVVNDFQYIQKVASRILVPSRVCPE